MLQNKTVTEMKNISVFISRLDMAKERISKIKNMSMEISQTEIQKEKE